MNSPAQPAFSDYIAYVDETGDHGLASIDPQFPMFGLVFCLVRKSDYMTSVVPPLQCLKFDTWGHDQVILHERCIRKQEPPFGFLRTDPVLRATFLERLNTIVAGAPIQLCVALIDKTKLKARYTTPYNPYEIALLFCMEWLLSHLLFFGQQGRHVPVIIEARGNKEDGELRAEFERICMNNKSWGWRKADFKQMSFGLHFVDKKVNSSGLQLADLTARPLALRILRPLQTNRAAEVALTKVARFKVFP